MTISRAMSARTLAGLIPAIFPVLSLEEFGPPVMACAGDSLLMAAAAKVAKVSSPMNMRGVFVTVCMTGTIRMSFVCDTQLGQDAKFCSWATGVQADDRNTECMLSNF